MSPPAEPEAYTIQLCDPMRLNEYSVTFPNYPWFEPIKPFEGWNANNTTKSIQWYDAYNSVKHDRENKFEQATLRAAFEAVAACGVLMAGQYGLHSEGAKRSSLKSFFSFPVVPNWLLTDIYIYPYDGETWNPINFSF